MAQLTLVDANAVVAGTIPERFLPHADALRAVVDWAWTYLCRPHPELGRRGSVCPYARSALTSGTFHLTVRHGRPRDPDEVADLLTQCRDQFIDLEPRAGVEAQLKTILVLFPDLDPADRTQIIDSSQRQLKAEYVEDGLMIGEFHDGPPDKAGLWNEDFRPLSSPVPMLVIRHMVPTDLAFLDSDPRYFAAYRQRFGRQIPAGLQARFDSATRRFELDLGLPELDDVRGGGR